MTTETKHMPSEREYPQREIFLKNGGYAMCQIMNWHEGPPPKYLACNQLERTDVPRQFLAKQAMGTWCEVDVHEAAQAANALTAASQSRAPDQSERATTPAARWREAGTPDPTPQDYERAALPLGHLTDDELANTAYLYTGYIPEDVSNAAKQRMRWLSRRLCETDAALAYARKVFSCADDIDWHHLDLLLGHSGHGKFWRAVFKDFRDWLTRNQESSK